MAYVDTLANSKFSQLRILAVDALSSLVMAIFAAEISWKYGEEDENVTEEEKVWADTWKEKIVYPLAELTKSGFNDTMESAVKSLQKIVQNYGQILDTISWSFIINALESVVEKGDSATCYNGISTS